MTDKSLRCRWMELGVCVSCGSRPSRPGLKWCTNCAESDKARKSRYVKSGKCQCGRERYPSSSRLCKSCNDSHKRKAIRGQEVVKAQIYAMYGDVCACCGESEKMFLTVDHINNDGARQKRSLNLGRSNFSSYKFQSWLINKKRPGIQILCFNCNCGKHRNKGICPHEDRKIKDLSLQPRLNLRGAVTTQTGV